MSKRQSNKKINDAEERVRLASLSVAEKRRYDDIVQIQGFLAQGFAQKDICRILNTSYKRIRRYAKGDPMKMCRYTGGKRPAKAEQYREEIIAYLKQNILRKEILARITEMGFDGKMSAFNCYCARLVEELNIDQARRKNAAGEVIKKSKKATAHYISRTDLFRHLWSGKELEGKDVVVILATFGHPARSIRPEESSHSARRIARIGRGRHLININQFPRKPRPRNTTELEATKDFHPLPNGGAFYMFSDKYSKNT